MSVVRAGYPHLRKLVDQGAAKFLFPLDADHAHLGVPMSSWKKKYQHLSAEEVVPALLRDPGLVALYHTAEHLRVTDRKTGEVNSEAKSWLDKRNVLGHFDGRPIEILPPHAAGQGASMPLILFLPRVSFSRARGRTLFSLGTKIVVCDLPRCASLENSRRKPWDPRLSRNDLMSQAGWCASAPTQGFVPCWPYALATVLSSYFDVKIRFASTLQRWPLVHQAGGSYRDVFLLRACGIKMTRVPKTMRAGSTARRQEAESRANASRSFSVSLALQVSSRQEIRSLYCSRAGRRRRRARDQCRACRLRSSLDEGENIVKVMTAGGKSFARKSAATANVGDACVARRHASMFRRASDDVPPGNPSAPANGAAHVSWVR